ncbi:hypothetical protein FQN55_004507 [Onygenales sp. PD_40]|nr:hypothetical protein FQN55_004507 [Onygenales sp. PD_40]
MPPDDMDPSHELARVPHRATADIATEPTLSNRQSTPTKTSIGNRLLAAIPVGLVFELFCLAWLLPIAALLWLNFKRQVIGASVACRIPAYKDACNLWQDLQQETVELDSKDHEILGVLQVVAKALEVWFGIVVGALVLDIAMVLLRHRRLPMNYFLTFLEFTSVLTLVTPRFWKSCFSRGASEPWLWAFALLVALLCIISNLMGPAVAVLGIPSLGWVEIQSPILETFGVTAASDRPKNTNIAPGCEEAALIARNFDCTSYFSSSVDEMSAALQWRRSLWDSGSSALEPILADGNVAFSYNSSDWGDISYGWVPSRQTLNEMSRDYLEIFTSKSTNKFEDAEHAIPGRPLNRHLYDYYRNSLDIEVYRKGPSLGAKGLCSTARLTDITVSDTKSVRCYNTTARADIGTYIECVRVGSGWTGSNTAHANFSIEDTDLPSVEKVSVNIYSTDRAQEVPEEDHHCIADRLSDGSCDWDRIFSPEEDAETKLLSSNIQFFEYTPSNLHSSDPTVVCQMNSHFLFADYTMQLTPSEINNTMVQLIVPTDIAPRRVFLHPDWVLAAWSVPHSGRVSGRRLVAANLARSIVQFANTPQPEEFDDLYTFVDVANDVWDQHRVVYNHALSLVDYTTLDSLENPATPDDPVHPLLLAFKKFRVWGYGNESGTLTLGLVISICGCICVASRTPFALMYFNRHRRPSGLEIVLAAFKYANNLEGSRKELEEGRVHFRRDKDAEGLGFVPV